MKKLAVLPLVLACSQAMAFDDNRQGFMMNFGIGLSDLDFKRGSYSGTELGINTAIKIGYGVNETFQTYFVIDASRIQLTDEAPIIGLTGIGANYYLAEKVYLTGAFGNGNILDDHGNFERGSAYSIGVGYELSPHQNVQLSHLAATFHFDYTPDLTTSALNLLYSYSLY